MIRWCLAGIVTAVVATLLPVPNAFAQGQRDYRADDREARRIAAVCRDSSPIAPTTEARVVDDKVILEMHGTRMVRQIPGDLHPSLHALLVERARARFSGIAACLRREGIERLPAPSSGDPPYRRTGEWAVRGFAAATLRFETVTAQDMDVLGNNGMAAEAFFWDQRRAQAVTFTEMLRPERQAAVRAMLCARLQEHPQPIASTLACPALERFNAGGLLPQCADRERLGRMLFWVNVQNPDPEGVRHSLALDVEVEDFLAHVKAEFADAFRPDRRVMCPPPI